jgi:hypothetical protein
VVNSVWIEEIYVRLYSKIVSGKSHYEGGKKYSRRREVYYYHSAVFCPEEQDRIIRIIEQGTVICNEYP